MRPGGDDWQELAERGYLLGNQATYDAFTTGRARLYWQQAKRGLFGHGIDAWWCDCTEPFEADWKGALKPEPEERLRINTEEAKRYLDPEPDQRLFAASFGGHLRRPARGQAAKAGGQPDAFGLPGPAALRDRHVVRRRERHVGDAAAPGRRRSQLLRDGHAVLDDRHRRLLRPAQARSSGSGPATMTRGSTTWATGSSTCAGSSSRAFLPMFRSHGTDTPREIWRFGEPGEPMYDALAEALRLRYRLLPYIYSLAGWTTHHAYTMLRMLAFDFRDDPSVLRVADEFMLGPAFLVCPVVAPMQYGPGSRPIAGAPTNATRPAAGRRRLVRPVDGSPPRGRRVDRGRGAARAHPGLRSCRLDRADGSCPPVTRTTRPTHPSSCTSIPAATPPSRCTKTRATGTGYEQGSCATTELTWDDARAVWSWVSERARILGCRRNATSSSSSTAARGSCPRESSRPTHLDSGTLGSGWWCGAPAGRDCVIPVGAADQGRTQQECPREPGCRRARSSISPRRVVSP